VGSPRRRVPLGGEGTFKSVDSKRKGRGRREKLVVIYPLGEAQKERLKTSVPRIFQGGGKGRLPNGLGRQGKEKRVAAENRWCKKRKKERRTEEDEENGKMTDVCRKGGRNRGE